MAELLGSDLRNPLAHLEQHVSRPLQGISTKRLSSRGHSEPRPTFSSQQGHGEQRPTFSFGHVGDASFVIGPGSSTKFDGLAGPLLPIAEAGSRPSNFHKKSITPRSALADAAVESIVSKFQRNASPGPLQSIPESAEKRFSKLQMARPSTFEASFEPRASVSAHSEKRGSKAPKGPTLSGALGTRNTSRFSTRGSTAIKIREQAPRRKGGNIPTARLADLVISPGTSTKHGEILAPMGVGLPKARQNDEHVDEIILLLQSRGGIASSEMLRPDFREEADEEDPVLAFWRVSTRCENVQVRMFQEDHLDYFVSHVWQPPPGFTNVDLYAQQKVQALEMFGRREAMLGGPNGDSKEPWFVLSSDEYGKEKERGNRDPGDDWRSYTCWVDKACSHSVLAPRSDLENTPAELIRATKSAIANCRIFTAVLYWHFFSRLWCVLEWAIFLADAAPDYRRARLVIHEELLENRNWDRITESVLGFSLSTLRSGNDQDHPELWLELESLMVSTVGFERFMQVTAYALLVRYLLLRCTRHCLAFGTDSDCTRKVNTIIESCRKLKLHGLARGLGSARPKHWWQLAIRRAKEQIEGHGRSQECSASVLSSEHASPRSVGQATTTKKEQTDKEVLAEARKNAAWDALSAKLEGKIRPWKPLHSEEVVQVPRGAANRDSVAAASKAMEHLKRRDECQHLLIAGIRTAVHEKLEHLKIPNLSLTKVDEEAPKVKEEAPSNDEEAPPSRGAQSQAGTSQAGGSQPNSSRAGTSHGGASPRSQAQTKATPCPSSLQDDCEDHVAAMQKVIGGLPDGFSPFWRGATGHLLHDTDRVRARVFLQAWRNYREYVNRWFDKYICPHIEVWRQRGIRARGLLEETFGAIFMNVDGSFQMSLCDQLAPGLRETTLASEAPPRGRPGRPCQAPWSNPSLDRLLVVSTGKGNDFPGSLGAGKQTKKSDKTMRTSRVSFCNEAQQASEKFTAPEPPTILLSPLGLELSGLSTHVLLQLTCGDASEAQTVQLPQRLGVEALNNAFKQLLHGAQQRQHAQITKLELEAIIPRTMLKVVGSGNARINLGMRLFGTLCASSAYESYSSRAHTADAVGEGTVAKRSGTPPPKLESFLDDSSTICSDDYIIDGIDWNRWQCRMIADVAEAAAAAEASSPRQEEKTPALPLAVRSEEIASQQAGFPLSGMTSPGLTPRRDRALAALYVNYSEDPASTCISPRRLQVTALNPLSRNLLEKARSNLAMAAEESANRATIMSHSPRTPRRNAGPGGMLPATAMPCPRQSPQIARLTARAASPTGRMKSLQALQSVDARASKTADEELDEKAFASTAVPAQVELIELMSRWEWSARGHGAPPEADRNVHWTGTINEIFNKLDEWVGIARRSGCPYCVPVSNMLVSNLPTPGASRVDGGGALIPTESKMGFWDSESSEDPNKRLQDVHGEAALLPLARAPPCSRCGHTDVANVSLENSMLRTIWDSPNCIICLRCGLTMPVSAEKAREHRALDGDSVLEVTTSIMLKAGTAPTMQQHILRVLRIEHGTVNIAAPAAPDGGVNLSAAKPNVAHICFTTRTTGMVAAAACSQRTRPVRHVTNPGRASVRYSAIATDRPTGLFNRDLDWAQGSLADTGLDLVYGMSRQIPINFAIGELDDRRTMPRRKDVCPLVLWAELAHVLSPEFDPNKWIAAAMQVCSQKQFSLPGAVMLRNNTNKLRKAVTDATPYRKNADAGSYHDEPISWPLALHRVLVARAGTEDGVLGVALSGVGVKATSPKELFQSGRTALARIHADKRSPSVSRASVVHNTIQKNFAFEQGRQERGATVMDAAKVMHELVHRRESGDASVGERALLRARRVLRHIQVVEYLHGLYEKLTDDNNNYHEADYDNNYHEDDDELVDDEEKSDDSDSEPEGSEENLLLQKVLGHIKEYVHYKDVALKAWSVMNVVVQTCSKFVENPLMNLQGRSRTVSRGSNIEQKVLDQGFVRTALRTLYRHHQRQDICEEVFTMLRHLVKPGHGVDKRTVEELSRPPTNAFVFVMSLCHFSEADRIELVKDNVRLLNLLFAKEHVEVPPELPEGREEEAAQELIPILYRHQKEMPIVMSILDLFAGMVRNPRMCCAFFSQGLTTELRQWLTDSSEDKQRTLWVKVKEAAGQMPGQSAKVGIKNLMRNRATALNNLLHQVATCETMCWEMICHLTIGSTLCHGFKEDSLKTIKHGLQEMKRRPRSRQWHHATQCLKNMVLSSTEHHAGRLFAEGCLEAISPEFPNEQVQEVMPFLIALLDESSPLIEPRRQPGESDDEIDNRRRSSRESVLKRRRKSQFHLKTVGMEQQDMAISEDSMDSEDEGEEAPVEDPSDLPRVSKKGLGGASKQTRRLLQTIAAMKRYKPEATDMDDAEMLPPPVMIDKAKGWLIAHKFVTNALKAMSRDYGEFTCHVRTEILRVLAQIFIPRYTAEKDDVDQLYLQSRAAVSEFENFGEEYGGGLLSVQHTLKAHLEDEELVDTGLYLLLGAFDMFQRVAERAADMDGFWEVIVHAAWKHCRSLKPRRRALLVLRRLREAKPQITGPLSELWQEKHMAFESESFLNPPDLPRTPDARRRSTGGVDESSLPDTPGRKSLGSEDHKDQVRVTPKRRKPPGDMVRLGAVFRVHAFYLEHGQRPLKEALEPLDKYTRDWEIAAVALSGITLGSKLEMENRFKELQKVTNFALIMRRAVEMYNDPKAFTPVLQLVNGVLSTNPQEKVRDELVETCAIACRVALENLEDKQYNNEDSWLDPDSWERFLVAAEAAGRSPGGKELFAREGIREILSEVWTQVEASEKDDDKSVVKLHKGQTVFVMELLG